MDSNSNVPAPPCAEPDVASAEDGVGGMRDMEDGKEAEGGLSVL